MEFGMLFVVFVIFLAYSFDFINGFHDAANAIATIVVTGVLTPKQAVLWAAFFNFVAFLFFKLMVAKTIGQDLIDVHLVDVSLIFSALTGAIVWGLLTWYLGLPSSSSHALIGGLAGAAMVKGGGLAALQWSGFSKVICGIIAAPLIGLLLSFLLTALLNQGLKHIHHKVLNKLFVGFQLLSSALLSLTHGGNDAQKTMGIIAILLFSTSWLSGEFYVPFWVVISCQLTMSLGTLVGGWRIVRTMGTKITHLNTFLGCIAETGAAAIISIATSVGVPVSTTQVVTGSIAGVGLVAGKRSVDWATLKVIFLAWLVTMPAAGLVSGFVMIFVKHLAH